MTNKFFHGLKLKIDKSPLDFRKQKNRYSDQIVNGISNNPVIAHGQIIYLQRMLLVPL